MALMTEQNTQTMERKVRKAFRQSRHHSGCCIEFFNAVFEHGQWWIVATYKEGHGDEDTRTFSVVDAIGGASIDGLDFEQV